jgi:hypothetical protein
MANLTSKQMNIAKASGDPNKIEASDFIALAKKGKKKFTKKIKKGVNKVKRKILKKTPTYKIGKKFVKKFQGDKLEKIKLLKEGTKLQKEKLRLAKLIREEEASRNKNTNKNTKMQREGLSKTQMGKAK